MQQTTSPQAGERTQIETAEARKSRIAEAALLRELTMEENGITAAYFSGHFVDMDRAERCNARAKIILEKLAALKAR